MGAKRQLCHKSIPNSFCRYSPTKAVEANTLPLEKAEFAEWLPMSRVGKATMEGYPTSVALFPQTYNPSLSMRKTQEQPALLKTCKAMENEERPKTYHRTEEPKQTQRTHVVPWTYSCNTREIRIKQAAVSYIISCDKCAVVMEAVNSWRLWGQGMPEPSALSLQCFYKSEDPKMYIKYWGCGPSDRGPRAKSSQLLMAREQSNMVERGLLGQ